MSGKIIIVMVILCILLIATDIVIMVNTACRQRKTHKNDGENTHKNDGEFGTTPTSLLNMYQLRYFNTVKGNVIVAVQIAPAGEGAGDVSLKEIGTQNFPALNNQDFAILMPGAGSKKFRSIRPAGLLYHPAHDFMVYGPACASSGSESPSCGDLPAPVFDITQNQQGRLGNISMAGSYFHRGVTWKCIPKGNSVCKTSPSKCYCDVTSSNWFVVTNTQNDSCDPSKPSECIDPNNILGCLPLGVMKVDSYPSTDVGRVGTPDRNLSGLVVLATLGTDCNSGFLEQQLGIYLYRTGGLFPFTAVSPATKCTTCSSPKKCNALGACQCPVVANPSLCDNTVDTPHNWPVPWTFDDVPPMQPVDMEINGNYIYVWGTDTGEGYVVVRLVMSNPKGIDGTTTISLDTTFGTGGVVKEKSKGIGGIMIEPSDPDTMGIITIRPNTFKNYISGSFSQIDNKKGAITVGNNTQLSVVYGGQTVDPLTVKNISGSVGSTFKITIDDTEYTYCAGSTKPGCVDGFIKDKLVYLEVSGQIIQVVDIPVIIRVFTSGNKEIDHYLTQSYEVLAGNYAMYIPYATYYDPNLEGHIMLGRDATGNLYHQSEYPIRLLTPSLNSPSGTSLKPVTQNPDSVVLGAKSITNYYNKMYFIPNRGTMVTGMATKKDGATSRIMFSLFR